MSDDVQQPGPDGAGKVKLGITADDTEAHRFRGAFTATGDDAPGPDGAGKVKLGVTDADTDDVEGHRKHIR